MKGYIKHIVQLALLLVGSLTALHSTATDSDPKPSWEWELDVGLAVSYGRGLIDGMVEQEDDIRLALLLSGGAYYGNFYVESNPTTHHPLTLGYVLERQESHEINLVMESYFYTIEDQYPSYDNPLTGIKPRKASLEAGIEYLTSIDKVDVRARLLHDVLSRHNGSIASVELARAYFTRHYFILPTFSVTYVSENALDYYFGVEQSETRLGRATYSAGDGLIATLSIYIERPLDDKWSLISYAGYSKFSSAFTDSPLVQPRADAFKVGLGVLWSF